MLSGLPKLLGRGFIIGYLLPTTLFHLAFLFTLKSFGLSQPRIFDDSSANLGAAVTLLQSTFSVVLFSIVLLAINRPLVRLFEGYGRWNPFRLLFERSKKQKFRECVEPILNEMERIDMALASMEDATPRIDDFAAKLYRAALLYPDKESWVLPTKFGNAMRASEVYPRVVYGIDGIPMWRHLTMIIPKQVDEKLKDARSILDFTLNMLALAIAMLIAYCAMAGCAMASRMPFDLVQVGIAVAVASVIAICWVLLPEVAVQWGFNVKAVFDLNRQRLARQLGFRLPQNAAEEFEFWQNVSQTMIYRSKYMFQKSDSFRRAAATSAKGTPDKKRRLKS
jgi:hypothetical protein